MPSPPRRWYLTTFTAPTSVHDDSLLGGSVTLPRSGR